MQIKTKNKGADKMSNEELKELKKWDSNIESIILDYISNMETDLLKHLEWYISEHNSINSLLNNSLLVDYAIDIFKRIMTMRYYYNSDQFNNKYNKGS